MAPSYSSSAIIANGAIHQPEKLAHQIKTYDQIIAVDGGLQYCAEMGITPHLIVGDMDSVSSQLLERFVNVPLYRVPEHKDQSDVEIAIETAIHPGIKKITIFGALEKRMDHTLANLLLMRRHPQLIQIESEFETLFMVATGETVVKCTPGQTVSLMPVGGEVTHVSSKGLKWELEDATLGNQLFSLSNVALRESFTVKFLRGELLCCLIK